MLLVHLLASIALEPVLAYQAFKVRKHTLKLPEASGLRKGEEGSGQNHLRLLILGDSAAAGVGVEFQSDALTGQTLTHLNPYFVVDWQLIARSGNTTFNTIKHLEEISSRAFDVVVVSLGVNDVISGLSVKKWMNGQKALTQLLRGKFSATYILLTSLPPVDQFPALPQPLRWYLGAQAKRYNRVLKIHSESWDGCEFLEFDTPADARTLMAVDGFHPGPSIYALWGKSTANYILKHWK